MSARGTVAGVRVLLFGCAPADATAAPTAALTHVATALGRRGHDADLIWVTPRWRTALPLGDHRLSDAPRTTLRRLDRPGGLDPCGLEEALVAQAAQALVAAAAATRPDAVMIDATDVDVFAGVAPHPRVMIVDDGAARALSATAELTRLEAWIAEGAAAVAAWRAAAPSRRGRGLRFDRLAPP